eukprot:CAMPEP_0184696008 /NCGR_PEP_ID=MMETSP0313-20130426/3443_1 /TAXON_ID=2792 /ORGANISM="Porphyridium aerugineum, Strain SAG 1380-2" /LENGTH=710 /DNA_ID=CAMNT_0027154555 /DNA_START=88 /DNA_END=2220 /DNA_ORIENTATION=-
MVTGTSGSASKQKQVRKRSRADEDAADLLLSASAEQTSSKKVSKERDQEGDIEMATVEANGVKPAKAKTSEFTYVNEYETVDAGKVDDSVRLFMKKKNFGPVNPLHDIPLFVDKEKGIYNMVVEIPRWTNAKLELKTKDQLSPIVQDEKKGKKRFVHNVYPYKGYIWNYGCFPQTWEDPTQVHMETGALGDGDPLDVCEVGSMVAAIGEVKPVKIIGVLGMIDEGEMDWKVLVIDVRDPMASKINDVEDLYHLMPGLVHATFSWFRTYKVPDGKAHNMFAFREQVQSKHYACEIIDECHQSWKKLIQGKVTHKNHHIMNTTQQSTPGLVSVTEAEAVIAPFIKAEVVAKEGAPKKGLHRTSSMTDMTDIPPPAYKELATKKPMLTIKRFCTELQRKFPHGSNDLSLLITELGIAYKCINGYICDHPHLDFGALASFANAQLHASLSSSGLCCLIYSSMANQSMPLESGIDVGNYIVVFNPLIGTPGLAMGSIFAVYYRKSAPGKEGDSSDLLQRTGYEQVAAGYCLFGSNTALTFSMGYGTHIFMLDMISGHFVLAQQHVRLPPTGPIYSIDTTVLKTVPEGVSQFVDELEAPGSSKVFRTEQNMVADFHKVLLKGGILMLPGPHKKDLANFLSEAAPLGFIARQAGGRASVGKRPLLELSAWSLEMSVPLFVGSTAEVDRAEELILGHACHEIETINVEALLTYDMASK